MPYPNPLNSHNSYDRPPLFASNTFQTHPLPLSNSRTRDAEQDTWITMVKDGLEKVERPRAHPPSLRNNAETRWPRGVLSGGTVIDMLEYLSVTAEPSDYAFVMWLHRHYIQPFGRIERLDGLLVMHDEDQYVHMPFPLLRSLLHITSALTDIHL